MHRTCKGLVTGFAVLAISGVVVAQPTFDLGIDGPDELVGSAGATVSGDYTLTMTPGGLDAGADGAQGWSISLSASGCASLVGITTEGTAADDVSNGGLRNTGFEVSELTTAARGGSGCEGRDGAVSAVVLSFVMNITLPADSASEIGKITVEGALPDEGDAPGAVEFVNGCQGAGQPVDNNVTWTGQTITPELGQKAIVCLVDPRCPLDGALNVVLQTENLLQVPDVAAGMIPDGEDDDVITDDGRLEVPVATGTTGTVAVYGAISSNLDGSGVQGCSVAVGVTGDVVLVGASIDGTAADDAANGGLRNTGFSVVERVDPERVPDSGPLAGAAQGQGAVSALVLSFVMDITLDAVGTATILRLDIDGGGPQGADAQEGTIAWVDGLQGSGQPVSNVATVAGNTVEFGCCQGATVAFTETVDPRAPILRGDANDDGDVDIADGVWIINELFRGGPSTSCLDVADANDDGLKDLSDATYIFAYRFQGGSAPAAPFPDCGKDGGDDGDDTDASICEAGSGSSACS